MRKIIFKLMCCMLFALPAYSITCIKDYGGENSCVNNKDTAGDCIALGYSTSDVQNCLQYMRCPFNSEYKRCVLSSTSSDIDCVAAGFTASDKTTWCISDKIIKCPADESLTLCAEMNPSIIDCAGVGFTTEDKSSWCLDIVKCPIDENYTLCNYAEQAPVVTKTCEEISTDTEYMKYATGMSCPTGFAGGDPIMVTDPSGVDIVCAACCKYSNPQSCLDGNENAVCTQIGNTMCYEPTSCVDGYVMQDGKCVADETCDNVSTGSEWTVYADNCFEKYSEPHVTTETVTTPSGNTITCQLCCKYNSSAAFYEDYPNATFKTGLCIELDGCQSGYVMIDGKCVSNNVCYDTKEECEDVYSSVTDFVECIYDEPDDCYRFGCISGYCNNGNATCKKICDDEEYPYTAKDLSSLEYTESCTGPTGSSSSDRCSTESTLYKCKYGTDGHDDEGNVICHDCYQDKDLCEKETNQKCEKDEDAAGNYCYNPSGNCLYDDVDDCQETTNKVCEFDYDMECYIPTNECLYSETDCEETENGCDVDENGCYILREDCPEGKVYDENMGGCTCPEGTHEFDSVCVCIHDSHDDCMSSEGRYVDCEPIENSECYRPTECWYTEDDVDKYDHCDEIDFGCYSCYNEGDECIIDESECKSQYGVAECMEDSEGCWHPQSSDEPEDCSCNGVGYFFGETYRYYDYDSCHTYCDMLVTYNCENGEPGDYGMPSCSDEDVERDMADCLSEVCACCEG